MGIRHQDNNTEASPAVASPLQIISKKLQMVTSKLKITQTQLYNEHCKVQHAKATSSLAKQNARSAGKENQVLGKEIEELKSAKEVAELELKAKWDSHTPKAEGRAGQLVTDAQDTMKTIFSQPFNYNYYHRHRVVKIF